ncbi:hypothetical protein DENSPDRAFT_885840 [Dentipellis sp. KUC8613]|nr:hypothetical protein DENSPDRAFT_885840 [Dentipellis sp. KUC8613]
MDLDFLAYPPCVSPAQLTLPTLAKETPAEEGSQEDPINAMPSRPRQPIPPALLRSSSTASSSTPLPVPLFSRLPDTSGPRPLPQTPHLDTPPRLDPPPPIGRNPQPLLHLNIPPCPASPPFPPTTSRPPVLSPHPLFPGAQEELRNLAATGADSQGRPTTRQIALSSSRHYRSLQPYSRHSLPAEQTVQLDPTITTYQCHRDHLKSRVEFIIAEINHLEEECHYLVKEVHDLEFRGPPTRPEWADIVDTNWLFPFNQALWDV